MALNVKAILEIIFCIFLPPVAVLMHSNYAIGASPLGKKAGPTFLLSCFAFPLVRPATLDVFSASIICIKSF